MISDYYANTYTVYEQSGSLDANGDYTEVATQVLSGKCKLVPLSGNKAIRTSDKQEVWANYRAYLPVVDLTDFKSIDIDDDLYRILFIANRIDHHLEVDLLKEQ